jgi:hypothetical protein
MSFEAQHFKPIRTLINPTADWITPEEQLTRLKGPRAQKVGEKVSALTAVLANYPPYSLTDWYTGLKRIGKLPEKIPPLPDHILEFLNGPCPKEICEKTKWNETSYPDHILEFLIGPCPEEICEKTKWNETSYPDHILEFLNGPCPEEICEKTKWDETSYKVREKCTLMLVPEELGTTNEFGSTVRSYGKAQNVEENSLLRYGLCCWDEDCEKLGNIPPEPTHWVLFTNDVLENSLGKSYQDQVNLVNSLAQKTLGDWQVPNLRDTIVTRFLQKIATGNGVWKKPNSDRLKEIIIDGSRLMSKRLHVGDFTCFGLKIYGLDGVDHFGNHRIGMSAAMK